MVHKTNLEWFWRQKTYWASKNIKKYTIKLVVNCVPAPWGMSRNHVKLLFCSEEIAILSHIENYCLLWRNVPILGRNISKTQFPYIRWAKQANNNYADTRQFLALQLITKLNIYIDKQNVIILCWFAFNNITYLLLKSKFTGSTSSNCTYH